MSKLYALNLLLSRAFRHYFQKTIQRSSKEQR